MAAGLTVFLGILVAAIWVTVRFGAPLIFRWCSGCSDCSC
jgi:hypothetical protein